jgi:hypothetical protein
MLLLQRSTEPNRRTVIAKEARITMAKNHHRHCRLASTFLAITRRARELFASASIALLVLFASVDSLVANGRQTSPLEDRSKLVESSKKAIIDTGFSERYFDEHFTLVEAFDKTGDTRIVWRFSLNGYQTLINDAMGYYSRDRGKRIYVHSVTTTLGSTRDITKTISRQKAEALMRSCLGNSVNETVVLTRLSSSDKLSLYLMAYSAKGSKKSETERRREAARNKIPRPKNSTADEPPNEGDGDDRPIPIGYINLETGKCSIGSASTTP